VRDVFISYAREDKPKAELIAQALGREGFSVWWDRKIPPGKSYREMIEQALDSAKCIIVLWSKQSVASDWVKDEASEGVSRRILVPAKIEDVIVPLGFRQFQTADLIGWKGDSAHPELRDLLDAVSAQVGRGRSPTESVAPAACEEAQQPVPKASQQASGKKEQRRREKQERLGAERQQVGWALQAMRYIDAKDYAKALPLLQKAADAGDTYGIYALGDLYENGRGVAKDYGKARQWYQKGADAGDTLAMVRLGILYEYGKGVAKDYGKARQWYQKAADAGDMFGMEHLGHLYKNGKGVAKDYGKARQWYQKAADAEKASTHGYRAIDLALALKVAML
jgi:TPR repeat protein